MKDQFTICVLLYGDHAELAARCLNSICRGAHAAMPDGLRVAMNQPSQSTEAYVESLVTHGWLLPHNVYKSPENLHKYPMMRWMFYDERNPITTPYVMWFDDDSYITDAVISSRPGFLSTVSEAMGAPDPVTNVLPCMCGSSYTIKITGNQRQWIEDQPWYDRVPISSPMRFATGGWWVARYGLLAAYDYPFPELDHRGGDVMLGALCQQQNLQIKNLRPGVAINADEHGRESKARRRGFDQRPVGYDYRRDLRDVAKACMEAPATPGPIAEALARAKSDKAPPVTDTAEQHPGDVIIRPRIYDHLDL
jgi:hypothetical protein